MRTILLTFPAWLPAGLVALACRERRDRDAGRASFAAHVAEMRRAREKELVA